jgi:hypothetical protein
MSSEFVTLRQPSPNAWEMNHGTMPACPCKRERHNRRMYLFRTQCAREFLPSGAPMMRAAPGLAAVVTLWPALCHAGTSAPFDIAGALLLLVGFVAILLLLFVCLIFAKSSSATRAFGGALAALVALPFAYGAITYAEDKIGLAKFERNVERNRVAYAAYCKQRDLRILARVSPDETDTIAIRLAPDSPAINWHVNGYYLAEYLNNNLAHCKTLNLRGVEEATEVYNVEKKMREPEYRRITLCERPSVTKLTEVTSRFEMLIGEQWRKDPAPWDGGGNNWLARSSVRIVDTRTNETLAQDTLHFLRYESGEGVCPVAIEQMGDLMMAVFSRGHPAH